MEQTTRPARKVAIADHIWDAFEQMAEEMGSDRDGLINQAMFMYARLNGFLNVTSHAEAAQHAVAQPVAAAAAQNGAARAQPARAAPVLQAAPPPPAREAPAPVRSRGMEEDPQRREVAERVLETAAELERLIKGKNQPPPPEPEEDAPLDDVDDGLGMDMDEPHHHEEDELPAEEGGLYLMAESGDMDKVSKDRFVIGRGKHCDFVINSGKVSREHAAIVHEGDAWFVEDLGSSNGTWFNKQRIKRRKVEDGDEYFICSEKIKLVFR